MLDYVVGGISTINMLILSMVLKKFYGIPERLSMLENKSMNHKEVEIEIEKHCGSCDLRIKYEYQEKTIDKLTDAQKENTMQIKEMNLKLSELCVLFKQLIEEAARKRRD